MNTSTTLKQSKVQRAFGFKPSGADRMFCYLWTENGKDEEPKFGERWVFAGLDPELDCWDRIRESVGVMKHRVNQDEIILHAIWDVSELAGRPIVGRMYQHGRMDDYIRPCIMQRIGRSEFHRLHWKIAVDRVTKFLASADAKAKPSVCLRQKQQRDLDFLVTTIKDLVASGRFDANIIANLCPRYGKTIWALAVFNAMSDLYGNDIMIVPVYWLSVLTSFDEDSAKYQEFSDIVVVRTSDPEAEAKAISAIQGGARILVLVSLHGKLIDHADGDEEVDGLPLSVWKGRHQWLQAIDNDRIVVFADEADFGTHTKQQIEKMNFLFS